MGINVHFIRKKGYLPTDDEICIGEPDWDVEKVDWWGSCRQVGDNDFVNNIDWKRSKTWREYLRPTSFEDTINWVIDNLSGSRRDDYIKALSAMEADPDLYFYISR